MPGSLAKWSPASSSTAGSSQLQTPQSAASSGAVQSPMTPTGVSRFRRKKLAMKALKVQLAATMERNKQLENENLAFTKQASHSEKKLERYRNCIQTKDKELTDARKMFDETATEKARLQLEADQLKKDFDSLKSKYDKKLKDDIQKISAEAERRLKANKDELERVYELKHADIRGQLEDLRPKISAKLAAEQKEISTLNIRLEEALKVSSQFEQEGHALQNRVRELEKKSDKDHSRFAKMLEEKDNTIDKLEKEKLIDQDLIDLKVALDNDISSKRKMPKGEKKGLSSSPLLATKKRKIEEDEESAFEYETNAVTHGDIEVLKDSPEGKYIRLKNNGDKQVALSGWSLTRRVATFEMTYKFHQEMKIGSKAVVTVWSGDVECAAHDLPDSTIMKPQIWLTSDSFITILSNDKGEEVARLETRRLQISQQRKRLGLDDSDEDFYEANDGEGALGDRCVIS